MADAMLALDDVEAGYGPLDVLHGVTLRVGAAEIVSLIVEAADAQGPYGAKEAGEGPLHPVIPAISNAIYDAVGVRMRSVPFTPDKVLAALKSA